MGGPGYILELELERDTYANGEIVKGNVILSLSLSKIILSPLKVRVGGYERALFYVPPNTDSYFSLPFYYYDSVIWTPDPENNGNLYTFYFIYYF